MKIMNRIETLEYLNNQYHKGRSIVSRYNDGEYLLMNNSEGTIANSKSGILSELLRKSIKVKGQFICINYLKPHNIEKKDLWYDAQKYLIQECQNELYGCSNYNVYDFCNDCSLISKYFIGNVLIVSGLVKESKDFFKNIQPNIDYYETPSSNAVEKYEIIKNDLEKICNKYDTILFSCGPLSKVLISDLISKCDSDLIDLGSILNAILNLTNDWTMSWTKEINLEEKRINFINKLIKG